MLQRGSLLLSDYHVAVFDIERAERAHGAIPANAIILLRTGRSALFESQRTLFAQNIPAFENLTSLERLPFRGASIMALPMKIGGGSGAPLRAVAILP